MKNTTLCFVLRNDKILLGLKKIGEVGEGKYNGFGGRVNEGERIDAAAVRELEEETGLIAKIQDLENVGTIEYTFPEHESYKSQKVHIYLIKKWLGTPRESQEMTCEWFKIRDIPYDKMWDDDKLWLPQVLKGEKLEADFIFGEGEKIEKHTIRELKN